MFLFRGVDNKFSIYERERFYRQNHFYGNYVLIKTCARVEVYIDEKTPFDFCKDVPIIKRLFGLCAGILSPITGETHIFNQVKNSYQDAINNKTISKNLHILFQYAFYVGKKVRTLTQINNGSPGYPLVIYKFLKEYFKNNLSNKTITIIGVNQINESLMKYLYKKGTKQIYMGNRTYEKALALSKKYNAEAFMLSNLKEVISMSDIIITATSAPHTIIKKEFVPINKNLIIIDLAFPPDVDEEVKSFKNIIYLNTQDLENRVKDEIKKKAVEVKKVEIIIDDEIEKFILKINKNEVFLCKNSELLQEIQNSL